MQTGTMMLPISNPAPLDLQTRVNSVKVNRQLDDPKWTQLSDAGRRHVWVVERRSWKQAATLFIRLKKPFTSCKDVC